MAMVNQDFTDDIKTYMSVNEILQVRIADDPASDTYHSRINDISEGKLVIAWPTYNGIRLVVHRDQILDFFFMREEVPHAFAGMVEDIDPGELPQLAIIMSSAVSRIQRRQNFRIKCLIPIELTWQSKDPKSEEGEVFHLQTITCDLSASGMAVRHSKRIPAGTLLEVKLALPDKGPVIKIPSLVMYSDAPAENQSLYRTGIRYLAIGESERARIVRYVYRTQLKGLRT